MSGKELFIRFTASAFRKLLPIYVFSCFPFGFVGRMWDLIISVPDHFLSFYFDKKLWAYINHLLQSEVGKYPLTIFASLLSLKYWLHINDDENPKAHDKFICQSLEMK